MVQELTHCFIMSQPAVPRVTTATMKGLVLASVNLTANSPSRPAPIATALLKVVINPNMELRVKELLFKPLLWYSVTIQDSKTVYISVVAMPPSIRPMKRITRSFRRVVRQETE